MAYSKKIIMVVFSANVREILKNCFLCCTVFFFGLYISFAQNDVCRKSTEGTEFWFGFMENRHIRENNYLEITVTARESTTFQVAVGPGGVAFNENYIVYADSSQQVKIPWELAEATGSEEVQDKGIHLTSEKPVNVYALNWSHNSADVAVIYPVGSLGKEYFAICYTPYIDVNQVEQGRNSEFLIVASEDETFVEITPSRVTDKGKSKDSTFSVVLDKGQVYQVQSENMPESHLEGQGDLTGSFISASKPVAFYSGSLSTRIPSGQCCWEHLYVQVPPVHLWGLEYFIVPLKSREQDRYRIMAAQNNTTVYMTGSQPFVINRGEFEEVVIFHNDPKRVLADKPVLVTQFSQSRDVDREFTGGDGDPFMIVLNPVNQSRNNVTFLAYQSPQLKKNFVNIITPTNEVGNIRLNSQIILDEFQQFPDGNYSFAQMEIEPGTHHLENVNGYGGFLAYVYGYGGIESYGYGVGFNLYLTLDLGESGEFQGDTLLLCHGDTILLDAGPWFDSYLWRTGETSQTLTVSEEGWYHVKTATLDGCELEDSVFVYVRSPVVELDQRYAEGCEPYAIELDAKEGFAGYLWQNEPGDTLSTSQTFVADESGKYIITVFDRYNCSASDTMELIIYPLPDIEFRGPELVCGEKTASLSVSVSGTPESLWNYEGGVEWTTDKDSLLIISEINNTSIRMEATDWGDYEIYYHLQTTDGCAKTDTFSIRFHPQPISDFVFENDEKCEGYSKRLIFEGEATDSASFYWDLDGVHFLDTLEEHHYLVSVGAFLDEYPSIKLVIDDNGCMSKPVIKPLEANPNFKMEADKRRGCDELTVVFSSELIVEDNVVYKWEFDDGETAETPHLTKHYGEPGFYDVTLTVTNPLTHCQNSYTIDSMIKVFPTPTAAISGDPDRCYSDSAHIFYTHSIDSSLCFWEFEGMYQMGDGNDSITVWIEEPTANVRLIVDEFGCISDTAKMQLKRKPRFDFFTESKEGCQPFFAEVIAEPFDEMLEFSWITDSLTYTDGSRNLYFFPDTGEYEIGLIAYSTETGCTDTLIKPGWIRVYPKPLAAFEVDYDLAFLENADISFTNQSENAYYYFWDFGDGSISAEKDPVYTYSEVGEYDAKLIAESLDGCEDTSSMLITILPFSVFTPNAFRPNSPVDENRTFMPLRPDAVHSGFNLKIYNRLGELVFESHSATNPWDGINMKGNPAPMGNYVWIARYFDIQGIERQQKGQVLLIR